MRSLWIILGLLSLALAPRQAQADTVTRPALVRFMLATNTYSDLTVRLNSQVLFQQGTNILSEPVAIEPDRAHTLEVLGYTFGEAGPELLHRDTGFRLAAGSSTISIFDDEGTEYRPALTPPVPAGKSILNATLIGRPASRPSLTFVGQDTDLLAGTTRYVIAEPRNAHQQLRAQPGYRYELILIPQPRQAPDAYSLVVLPISPQYAARETEVRLFRETGHVLEGRFRDYWERTGGLPVFGFPLNDDHYEGTTEGGFVTQIFERNRFEYHAANRAPYDVQLGRLGDERLRQSGRDWRAEYRSRPVGAGCEGMTVDGRQIAVCEPFLSYYRSHGLELDGKAAVTPEESLALFGLPLTQAAMETNSSGDRVLTQWFERARFEHHPNNPAGQRVLLGRLGAEVYGLEPFTFDDDDHGFTRRSRPDDSQWHLAEGGFGGHFYFSCVPPETERGSGVAQWVARVAPGTYQLQVFVPGTHANARQVSVSIFEVGSDNGSGGPLNQKPYMDEWVPMGTFSGQNVAVSISAAGAASGDCTYRLAVDAIRLVPRPERLPSYRDPQGRFTLDYPFDWTQRANATGADVVFEAPRGGSLLAARLLPASAAPDVLPTTDPGTLFPTFVERGAELAKFPVVEHLDEVLLEYTGRTPDGKPVAGALGLLRKNGRLYAGLYRADPDRWYTERGFSYPAAQGMRPVQQ